MKNCSLSILTGLSVIVGVSSLTLEASAFVLAPTTPGKWGSPALGQGATITYSFMPSGTRCRQEFGRCVITGVEELESGFETEIEKAFASWSAVADVNFIQLPDDGKSFNSRSTDSGDIRLGGHFIDGVGGILAEGYFPPLNGFTAAGDIHFDGSENWTIDALDGNRRTVDIFQVAAHEIGHALGLRHTDIPNSLMNPFYTEDFSGPQSDDIAGAQFLYGLPTGDSNAPLTLAAGSVETLSSRQLAHVPEPSSSITLLAFGILGAASTLQRRRC